MGNRKRPVLGIVCLLYTVVILTAGLLPFKIHPLNKVEWLRDGVGIRFYGQGIVFSQFPLVVQEPASGNGSFTIELLSRSHKESTNGTPSILTLYDRNKEQFIFGQYKNELFIRIPTTKADSHKRYREIGLADVFKKDATHLITVASQKKSTAIYVDGEFSRRFPRYSLIPSDGGLSGLLILGNSPEGTSSWRGSVLGLAIYNRMLTRKEALDHYHAWQNPKQTLVPDVRSDSQTDKQTNLRRAKPIALYLFDDLGEQVKDLSGNNNNLLIPATFHPLRRIILGVPAKDQWFSRSNLSDVAVNFLGFLPFGFFLSAWLREVKNLPAPRAYGISIPLGFCLSLVVELSQVYLPTRDSSLLDVISNTIGTAAGALLSKYTLPILHKAKRDHTSPP